MRCSWLLAFVLFPCALGCGTDEIEDETPLEGVLLPDGKADGVGSTPWALSASSVQSLKGSLASVRPAVRTANPGNVPEDYLDPYSALGPEGPLGAWGPLGALGPVGSGAWNSSAWISAIGDW